MSGALPSDPTELRAMIAALEAENARMAEENARIGAILRAKEVLIAALEAHLAKLRRQRFGRSSEKVERDIEQLELALEDLQVAAVESGVVPAEDAGEDGLEEARPEAPDASLKPRRRPRVADGTPRERREIGPGDACPDCGGELRIVGEDVSELVDLIAAKLRLIEIARPKASCRRCEKMVQAPAPSRPIPRSMAGPGLLAQILVSKFDDHMPLYRQSEIFSRMGADIPDSTLVDWCGGGMKVLHPVIERIEEAVFAADLIHADGTPQGGAGQGRQAGPHLGLRLRPAAMGGTGPARRRLSLLPRPQGRASEGAPRRELRHPPSRRLFRLPRALRDAARRQPASVPRAMRETG